MIAVGKKIVCGGVGICHYIVMKIRKISKKVNQQELDPHERLFVIEYLKDFNAVGALRRCGRTYSSDGVARNIACGMMANPSIHDAIAKEFEKRKAKVEVDVELVLRNFKMMAEADLKDAFNLDGSIKKIHDMPDGVRLMISSMEVEYPISRPGYRVVKIKMWPKDKANEMLGKYLQMWIERKIVAQGDVSDTKFMEEFFGLKQGSVKQQE